MSKTTGVKARIKSLGHNGFKKINSKADLAAVVKKHKLPWPYSWLVQMVLWVLPKVPRNRDLVDAFQIIAGVAGLASRALESKPAIAKACKELEAEVERILNDG